MKDEWCWIGFEERRFFNENESESESKIKVIAIDSNRSCFAIFLICNLTLINSSRAYDNNKNNEMNSCSF